MSTSSMSIRPRFRRFSSYGLALVAVAAAGFWAGQMRSGERPGAVFANSLPVLDTAARGKSLSLATGIIEENVEALYSLDHLTGELSCYILNSRTGALQVQIRAQVNDLMGIPGEADYVMSTGYMDFVGGVDGTGRPANSVVYIGDGNTGKVAGFVLFYNKQLLNEGNPAGGQLQMICQMETREIGAIRGQDNR